MLRRGVSILTALRRAIAVLLRLLWVALMTTKSAPCYLWLESTILRCLPLTDVAEEDVLGFHGNEWDPAELEPGSCFCLDHLGVVASRTDTCCAIAFLLHLGGAAKDDWDEEAEVLQGQMRIETKESEDQQSGNSGGNAKEGGLEGGDLPCWAKFAFRWY